MREGNIKITNKIKYGNIHNNANLVLNIKLYIKSIAYVISLINNFKVHLNTTNKIFNSNPF